MKKLIDLTSGKYSHDCYVIAEAGLNHNGSVKIAKALIDVAAIAGTDAVKFQKRTVEKLAVKSVLDAQDDRFPEFGKTYREIRQHLEFSLEEYRELKDYAQSKGLDFMVTAFDTEAVDFLEELGVEAYKLASHSATNLQLLDYLARLRKPTVLSTGMAELEELDRAVEIFRRHDAPLVLLHCVSAYPTPLAECNLAMIDVLKARYSLPVGYSGHELGYLPTVVAVSMGAQMVERHFTLNKTMVGFDHKMSLEPDELIAMVRDIRNVAKIRGTGEKRVSETEWVTRRKYHVSMVSAVTVKVGSVLSETMVSYRNPGTGIPSKLAHTVLGKRALRDIPADELLSADMFE
ncbi:MAG: N-acetylneuraminate synthase family protein [Nitrosomonadaceae bacterium]|nr:N-acetylneuraminate synthase family protein [Nitrosomonadaceae bacterium]